MTSFIESTIEEATLSWLSELGWNVLYGPDIAPEMPAAECSDFSQVVLDQRLREVMLSNIIFNKLWMPTMTEVQNKNKARLSEPVS